ncbi:hypothetical protein V8C35DRAFT_292385 [Trichoderma chlorosporum]
MQTSTQCRGRGAAEGKQQIVAKPKKQRDKAQLARGTRQLLMLKSVSKSMTMAVSSKAARRIAWRRPPVANQRLARLGPLQSGGHRVGLGNLADSWPLVCIVSAIPRRSFSG